MKIEAFHNWELDRAIRESGKDAQDIARAANIRPGILSGIKRGRIRPDDEEEKALAKVLGLPVNKLFMRYEVAERV